MMVICLELISKSRPHRFIDKSLEIIKSRDKHKLIQLRSETTEFAEYYYIPINLTISSILDSAPADISHMIASSSRCSFLSPGDFSVAIKERIPLEELFLAYKPNK